MQNTSLKLAHVLNFMLRVAAFVSNNAAFQKTAFGVKQACYRPPRIFRPDF